ncbi:MAG: PIN domain-containing protein [Gemmatimonadaceae bacterium]
MNAYVDSSVVLRMVLGQPDRLVEWRRITRGVASGLIEVEGLRTIDRLCASGQLSIEDAVVRRETAFRILDGIDLIDVTPAVLRRAAQPMPTPLGTLVAIHLATAELWREERGGPLTFATHDRALALAARASGFSVVGV